jgi:uncharacterized membrane-anchored protein YhcB (DUF1043 family)
MKDQKENIKVVVSFILVAVVVGLVVYVLMNRNKDLDLNQNEIYDNQIQNQEDNINKQVEPIENNMEQDTKILNNFTPINKNKNDTQIDKIK